jgi:ABC-2 type transport system permease protein
VTAYYLRLEIVRMLRDPRFLALAVAAPIGFYLLFATLFGGQPAPPGQLPGTVEIMVAQAAYGAIWAVLSTTGPRIAQERETGWVAQLRTLPLPGSRVLLAKVVASVAVALPAIVLVCLTGAAVKDVSLSIPQWTVMVAAMWVGTVPFAGLGIVLGYAIGADASFVASYGVYMAMSAIGGLWVPPAVMPQTFRDIAAWLPTNRLADLGWRVAGGQAWPWSSVFVLAAWTLGLGALALVAYRRRGTR